jgi:hypothetical protein
MSYTSLLDGGVSVALSVVVPADEREVDGDGLHVDLLVVDLRPANPLLRMVLQELFEVGRNLGAGQQFLYKNVVVLRSLPHTVQQTHNLVQVLAFISTLHEANKSFEEILRQVLGISFG